MSQYQYTESNGTVVTYTPEQVVQIAEIVRSQRNTLLQQTDFWALSDRPDMTQEQISYRQSLRDLTSHPNWPLLYPEDWPTKP